MITRGRRDFVSQSIWYFLNQDYAARELIVVDDRDEPVEDLVPSDSRIQYLRLDHAAALGVKCNLGCEAATGDLILHWEEDAWYSPRRLSTQVTQFADDRVHLAGLDGVLHYQPLTGRLWRHVAAAGRARRPHPASLAYRRSHWRAHRFGEAGSDSVGTFVATTPAERVNVRDGGRLAVAMLPGAHAGGVNVADRRWEPRPYHEVGQLLNGDAQFYAGLRVRTRRPKRPITASVTLAATFMVYDGYGSMAEYLALGMARSGADVQIAPFRIDPASMSDEFIALWRGSRPDRDGTVLCHAWWGENLASFGSARDLFVKTAWETSRLPADWAERLNTTTAVFVPSHFAAQVFRESGVRVPIEVVHEGIDRAVYPLVERPARTGLTTLVVGVLAPRKNWQVAVEAWKCAFADDRDARLILKARFQLERFEPDDPRIQVIDRNEPTRGILDYYRQADVLLALGNEGFGLPMVEGMATGLPVIALDAEAQGDVCAEADGAVLRVPPARFEPVDDPPFGPCGVRAIPDVDAATRQLSWVADHRAEARALGRRASAWAHAHRDVWELGPATLEAMERHVHSPRPLRRANAMCVPDVSERAGLGGYAEALVEAVGPVRRCAAPAEASGCDVLHVQLLGHGGDHDLAEELGAARRRGTTIVITEHRIGEHALAHEHQADALVALGADDAALLRARWPGKRVEVIAPGCPPWHAAERDRNTRTIALVGATLSDADADAIGARLVRPGAGLMGAALSLWCSRSADLTVVGGDPERPTATRMRTRAALAGGAPVVLVDVKDPELSAFTAPAGDLLETARRLLEVPPERAQLVRAAQRFCNEHDWTRVAARHHALWRALR